MYVWTGGLHGGHVQSWADLWRRLLRVYVGVCGYPGGRDTHRSWLMHSGCTLAWNWQVLPVPHAHADTRHTLADTMPRLPQAGHQASQKATGNSNQAWARAKHGLETASAEPAAGWGAPWATGWWGPHPTLLGCASPCLCPEVSSGIFHFMEKPQDWDWRERFWGPRRGPLGPPSPGLNVSSHARRSLSGL